jgi:hypothetical protein
MLYNVKPDVLKILELFIENIYSLLNIHCNIHICYFIYIFIILNKID